MKLTITKTGKLSKCTLTKTETEVVLTEGIVTISAKAFDSCREKITKLVISEGVTTIEAEACRGMTALTELVLPSTLTTVHHDAFAGCTALKEVFLPDGLQELYWHAFADCTNLEKLHLPNTLTKLPPCIHGCDQIKTLEIPDSVRWIGLYALQETCIEEIVLPQGVEYIDSQAFHRCEHLKKVTMPASITGFGVNAFGDCTALEEVTLPAELEIPAGQKDKLSYFAGCSALKRASMTREHAKKLLKATAAQLKKDSMPYAAEKDKFGIFEGCTALEEIIFLAEDTSRWSDGTCDFKTEADGEHLLRCLKTGILEYTVPDSVTVIEDKAFSGNTRLKKLTLNDKLKRLDLRQFSGCRIDSLTIPDTLTDIADNNFSALSHLNQYGKKEWASIQIFPTHPSYGIQDEMLYTKKDGAPHTLLYNLQPVRWNALVIPQGIEVLAPSCCEESKQAEVQLPDSLRVIGKRAFCNNRNLEKINLPEGLEEIGAEAFLGCRSLMELRIPDSVTRYPEAPIVPQKTVILCTQGSAADQYARKNKQDVRYIGQTVKAEGEAAPQAEETPLFDWGKGKDQQIVGSFLGGVDEVTLPIEIGGIAVKGYDSKLLARVRKRIKSIIVPEGITEIPADFFARCECLETVVLPSTLKSIGANAFSGCWSLTQIETPEGVTAIDPSAFSTGGLGENSMIVRGKWGSAIHAAAQANGCRFVETDADEQTQQLQEKFSVWENEDGTLTILQIFGINAWSKGEKCEIPAAINGRAVTGIDEKVLTPPTLILSKNIRTVPMSILSKVEELIIDPENPHLKADALMCYSKDGKVLEGVLRSARSSSELIVPDGVEIISADALTYRIYLEKIYIPASVRAIRIKARDGSVQDDIQGYFLIRVGCIAGQQGSYAERLADMNQVTFLPDGESEELHALRRTFGVYRITEELTKKFPARYPEGTEGGLAVNGYRGSDSEVWIPEQISGETISVIRELNADSVKAVHIPASVRSIEHIAVREAIYVSEDNPVFYSEDGKLYDREKRMLLSCPKDSDHTCFWPEMQEIGAGALDDLRADMLILSEGVRSWKGRTCKAEVNRLILPRTMKEFVKLQAKEIVLHDSQMMLLICCGECKKVIVLGEQGQVRYILTGAVFKALEPAAWGERYLYQELAAVCRETIQSPEEVTPEIMLRWYDTQFEKVKNSEDKLCYAMYRLCAEHGLAQWNKDQLTAYLHRTAKKAMQFAVDENDIKLLKMLLENGIVTSKNSQPLIELLSEKNMIEWTAMLLEGTRKV